MRCGDGHRSDLPIAGGPRRGLLIQSRSVMRRMAPGRHSPERGVKLAPGCVRELACANTRGKVPVKLNHPSAILRRPCSSIRDSFEQIGAPAQQPCDTTSRLPRSPSPRRCLGSSGGRAGIEHRRLPARLWLLLQETAFALLHLAGRGRMGRASKTRRAGRRGEL
jgi:hypothetical protein